MSAVLQARPAAFLPMQADDLDRVTAIEASIYPFPWTRGNFLDSLHAGHSAWTMRAEDGTLIGYAVVMIALDEAHLLNLSIDASWQRNGNGWRLLEWVADVARGHGARSMLLEVRPSNLAGLHLYERYGFERIGLRRGYYPAHEGREDAIVMRISL